MFLNSKQTQKIKEAIAVLHEVNNGDFEQRIHNIEGNYLTIELLNGINELIDRSDAFVRESTAATQHIADNKYYRTIMETSMSGNYLVAAKKSNEAMQTMSQKVLRFSQLIDNLETEMGDMSSSSDKLHESAQHMQDIASSALSQAKVVSRASEDSAMNVQNVASASEELT